MKNDEVKAKVEEYLAFWQKQLRLQDWDVAVNVPAHDIECTAQVHRTNVFNTAKIDVRNPAMHPPTSSANPDLEYTTVDHKRPSAEDDAFEMGIELVAQALVKMRRGEIRQ